MRSKIKEAQDITTEYHSSSRGLFHSSIKGVNCFFLDQFVSMFYCLNTNQVIRNVASFNTIIETLQNDQSKIKLIRTYESTRKKISIIVY